MTLSTPVRSISADALYSCEKRLDERHVDMNKNKKKVVKEDEDLITTSLSKS